MADKENCGYTWSLLIIGLLIGVIAAYLLINNLLAKAQQCPSPQNWVIKPEGFESNIPTYSCPVFDNPQYSLGDSSDCIDQNLFENAAYSSEADRKMNVEPVPASFMGAAYINEWGIPNVPAGQSPNQINELMDKAAADTHYTNEWGDTICKSCEKNKDGSMNRHKKKDL